MACRYVLQDIREADYGAEHDLARILRDPARVARRVVAAVAAVALFLAVRGTIGLDRNERLSTVEADRALREAGASGRERRRAVDRSAATVIRSFRCTATSAPNSHRYCTRL